MLDWFGRKLREMQEVKRDERGFTLIELLVVVIIIGILAAIAIPIFLGQRERAQDASATSDLRSGASAMETFYVDDQTFTGADVATMEAIEPSIEWAAGASASGTEGQVVIVDTPGGEDYTLESLSASGQNFEIVRDANGTTEVTEVP